MAENRPVVTAYRLLAVSRLSEMLEADDCGHFAIIMTGWFNWSTP